VAVCQQILCYSGEKPCLEAAEASAALADPARTAVLDESVVACLRVSEAEAEARLAPPELLLTSGHPLPELPAGLSVWVAASEAPSGVPLGSTGANPVEAEAAAVQYLEDSNERRCRIHPLGVWPILWPTPRILDLRRPEYALRSPQEEKPSPALAEASVRKGQVPSVQQATLAAREA